MLTFRIVTLGGRKFLEYLEDEKLFGRHAFPTNGDYLVRERLHELHRRTTGVDVSCDQKREDDP